MTGTVLQVNIKSKVPGERGLPKYSVKHSYATAQGLDGDYNIFRQTKKKGDKDMALLVYPIETIQELNQEGWPVQPGDVGENLTVKGFAHDTFKVGQRIRQETQRLKYPWNVILVLTWVYSPISVRSISLLL